MKRVIVIVDGAADYPIASLGDKTPLEHAFLPHMSFLAHHGRVGLIDNVFDDLPVGSIVAALGLLGYDPYEHFPHGRASFEALASGIQLRQGDLAFRCNLISLEEGAGGPAIGDFTASLIDDSIAHNIVMGYRQSNPNIELFPSQSYRNILVYRGANVPASSFHCYPPHQHRGRAVIDAPITSTSTSDDAMRIAQELNTFLTHSRDELVRLNQVYESDADSFWLWSPSDAPSLPSFVSRFGCQAAVVGGLHFLRGIGIAGQMISPKVEGATGYIDSNLHGKLQAALRLLEQVDVVLIHINAPDEEAHQGNVEGKVRAIELVDEVIVGPLVQHMRRRFPGQFRLSILPDHYTCLKDGRHIVHPVPFLAYGAGIQPDGAVAFHERESVREGSMSLMAWDLMPYLIDLTEPASP